MNSHTSLFMTQTEGPEKRLWPAIVGQQRRVNVQASQTWNGKDGWRNNERKTSYTEQVWLIACKEFKHYRVIETGYFPQRQFMVPGQLLHGGMQRGLIDW